MITIPALTAPGQIVQHLVAPAVYLDHWAFRAISSDEGWARRFAAGLEKHQGTLAFSWANVAEFRGVLDEKQARQAEEFINANFPRVFCIQVDPFQVIQREGGGQGSPEADDEVLRALAGLARPPHLITADGLLTVVKGRLEEQGERLAKIFMNRHHALSDTYASDEDFRELVGKAPKSAATLSVLREILAAFLVDRTWKADAHPSAGSGPTSPKPIPG
jgi:hypothetical protein